MVYYNAHMVNVGWTKNFTFSVYHIVASIQDKMKWISH